MGGYVYILSNKINTVLYIGVTVNLIKRIHEHKLKLVLGFSQKYNVTKLVHYEQFDRIEDAIYREKQLKNWKRKWKDDLIKKENPSYDDLYAKLL